MKHWLNAFRLRTLPLAASSIIVGSAIAYHEGLFRADVMALALLTAILLQILSNLANDLGDHEHGTDNEDRIGPTRTVQGGLITPAAMKRAMLITAALAFLSGLWLIILVFGFTLPMLTFLFIGILAIGAAVKYTFGSNPYGYAGLGDIAVFLFFGLVGVIGTYYLHTMRFEATILMPAMAFGLLSAGVLNVNNMRDIGNDAASGKRTLVVRMGLKGARNYHAFLIGLPFFLLVRYATSAIDGHWAWLFLLGFIPIGIHSYRLQTGGHGFNFDPELKRLALGTFATAITLSIGLWLS